MTMSSNQIFDCLELNTPSTKHNIEEYLHQQRSSSDSLCHLLIDVDTTLERLYGGYHADWLSGGEWSHLHSYILSLLKTCQDLSLCLIFCFDGTLYRSGQSQWYYEQTKQRKKVNQIFKHLKQNKVGLPRRHLWFSPPAFQLCFRLILRQLNSPHLLMYQTYGYGHGEHQNQVKTYARQYASSLIGIVSSDMEFFFPIENNEEKYLCKYFSSKHLKLSLKGQITLVQIQLNQIKEKFNLNNQQFALLLTLLGNHILSESDLNHFHNDLLHMASKPISIVSPSSTNDLSTSEACSPDNTSEEQQQQQQQISSNQSRSTDQLCTRLVEFIKKSNFENENDLNSISNQIFKHLSDDDIRQSKYQLIMDSYHYYYQAINESIELENSPTSFPSSQVSINKSDDNLLFENTSSGINIEVLRTALNLHKQGLMMPWVFQCLSKREITFPVSIEPEMCATIPNICEFYRPIRKYLYSILFEPSTIVREQVYNSEHGSYLNEISSEYLSGKATIEQLWFGTNPDQDRTIRLKTFLQSLIHCDLPIISSQKHEYLLLICLLRYIFIEMNRSSTTTFHTYELLAFLSQAVLINELKNVVNLSNIQIKTYETRAIQLAHLFVRGYETIMFANEITGAPIHPKYSCLTTIFHGKYFHQKYLQAQYYQQNQDLIFILADGNVHCAQIISHLFDIILDRSANNKNTNQTPIQQQQQQYSIIPPQQQRILKQERTQKFVANSTRQPMRSNHKHVDYNNQQTPITNFRQQPSAPIKQQAQIRNGINKKNNNNNSVTPFNIKNQSQTKNLQSHTPIQSNQQFFTNEQWNSNHLTIPNQKTYAINNMQAVPIQHANYINQLDEQFLHLQIQQPTLPQPILSSPLAYSPHPSAMLTPQFPIIAYNHIHPSPYSLPAYYPTSTTPYQPLPQSQILPGLPPHAPIHYQRTTNYPSQRLSPTSMQTFQQQTPISIQRQMHHIPNLDYSQFDVYHSTPSTTMPIPPMLIDHTQRLHSH